MKEHKDNLESIDLNSLGQQKNVFKKCPFFINDSLKDIKNLVIQMSKIPLRSEQHDCK